MVLTKLWLQAEIETEPNPAIKLALERIFLKYTEAPTKGNSNPQTKLKDFDADETFKKVVKYYVDKKGYKLKQAEKVAKSVVIREKVRRDLWFGLEIRNSQGNYN